MPDKAPCTKKDRSRAPKVSNKAGTVRMALSFIANAINRMTPRAKPGIAAARNNAQSQIPRGFSLQLCFRVAALSFTASSGPTSWATSTGTSRFESD
jgi:hypothetical protein